MREEHIIDMLESGPLARLSESELASIRAHTAHCDRCSRAFQAARASALLLKERAAETFEPSPFFQTKVLAALRQQQAAKETWSLVRLWRATNALVSSMAATVAALAVLTFLAPGAQPPSGTQEDAASVTSSAEEVFLAQDELPDEEMTYEQVLTTLYESGDEGAR